MKTDIKKGELWWQWNEVCDNCGTQTKSHGSFLSSGEPDINKKDYCNKCMRKMLDDKDKK